MTDNTITPTFTGEIQLAGWSESHTSGCKVTFWLQSPDELEAFRALTVRKGNTAGHRFMAALVEIGDDEMPVEPPKPKVGALCLLAVQWCKEPKFWTFCNNTEVFSTADDVGSEDEAAELICYICAIDSRKELDTNDSAAKMFDRNFRKPYMEFLKNERLAA